MKVIFFKQILDCANLIDKRQAKHSNKRSYTQYFIQIDINATQDVHRSHDTHPDSLQSLKTTTI